MHAFRSRVGAISVTTGTAVLLALPAVAAGQVPGVDQVVGEVTETAQSIVPIPALPAPPAQAPAPVAPAPAPAPAITAPAAPAPAAPAPAAAPRQSTSAPAQPAVSSPGSASARSAPMAASAAQAKAKRGVSAHSAADPPANASQDDSSEERAGSGDASRLADLPEDAGPDTLPFTGLQLALIAMAGLATLAGGIGLRRGTRIARR